MEQFRKLKLTENLLRALKDANFEVPSEIQEKAIPLILEGKDILGSSATGSGKTLAFGAGIIEHTQRGQGVQALILTPTRELAEQVATSLRKFATYHNLFIKEIYGGTSMYPQIRALERADVVVGTPGRILDHLERRTLDLSKVKTLVLDEADRMLDMGFIDDVKKIIDHCPRERQTLLFSATLSREIKSLARQYLKDPVHIAVDNYVDPKKLAQVSYDVKSNMKFSLLVHLLKKERAGLVMVFCNTRRNVDMLTKNLRRYEVDALAIHGGLAQNKRKAIMERFNSSSTQVLVCTDVAARGLDIKNVSHVYNYDLPASSEEYIHRIGRTARAGKEGVAVSLVSQRDYESFANICKDHSLRIDFEPLPADLRYIEVNFKSGGHKDRRRFHGGDHRGEQGRGREREHRRAEDRHGDKEYRPKEERREHGRNRSHEKRFEERPRRESGDRERPRGRFNDRSRREGGRRSFGQRNFGAKRSFGQKRSFGNTGKFERGQSKERRESREGSSSKYGSSFGDRQSFGKRRKFGRSHFSGGRSRSQGREFGGRHSGGRRR